MKYVEQTGEDDCGPACLAMVTGRDLEAVKASPIIETPLPTYHAWIYLEVNEGRSCEPVTEVDFPVFLGAFESALDISTLEDRTFLLQVESPGDANFHMVVLHDGELYDPKPYWQSTEDAERAVIIWAYEITKHER